MTCILACARQRCTYVDNLKSSLVLTSKALLYGFLSGNNVGTLHFLWELPDNAIKEEIAAGNANALYKIHPCLPVYHTRAMRAIF